MMLRNRCVLLLVLGLAVALASAGKPRKYKNSYFTWKKFANLEDKLDILQKEEAEINYNEDISRDNSQEVKMKDPCVDKNCGTGQECIINLKGEAECQCVEECQGVEDDRRRVCSNFNETWSSDCELYRMRCYCMDDHTKCANNKLKHMHIDYYGDCQTKPVCLKEEMSDFPRRMREWLFNIMRDMVDRNVLSEHYKKLEEIAEDNESKMWITAAVWKWCEMDGYPKDRSVSRHELFPLRAPLYTLEHCIAPFLDSCDSNNDHKVTLREWTSCLELSNDQVDDMEDLCEDIKDQ